MDIQLPQLIFQLINFAVVAGALTYLLYKPVRKMLEERSARIEEAQKAAEATLAEKKQIDEMKKKALIEAEKQAAAILEEAKQGAKKVEKDLREKAIKTVEGEVARQRKQLTDERDSMVKELRSQFVKEVSAMTEKVLGEAVDQKVIAKKLDKDIDMVLAKI